MSTATRNAVIVGGPNGAGKTTFVEELLRDLDYRYLGADLIAAQIAPTHPESVAFIAGREFVTQIDEAVGRGENIIVETTLSGRSFRNVMGDLKARNYRVKLAFIFLKSPQAHVDRVAKRVQKGGHHVPADDVVRRYSRSLQNFWQIYRNLADEWSLYYNSDRGFTLVALGDPSGYLVLRDDLFEGMINHGYRR